MAGRRSTSEKIQAIRDFTAHWGKIVARRALENAGPDAGFAFQAMEDLAAAAAAGLTEGTLAALLEQRARTLPAEGEAEDKAVEAAAKPRPDDERRARATWETTPAGWITRAIGVPVCR